MKHWVSRSPWKVLEETTRKQKSLALVLDSEISLLTSLTLSDVRICSATKPYSCWHLFTLFPRWPVVWKTSHSLGIWKWLMKSWSNVCCLWCAAMCWNKQNWNAWDALSTMWRTLLLRRAVVEKKCFACGVVPCVMWWAQNKQNFSHFSWNAQCTLSKMWRTLLL